MGVPIAVTPAVAAWAGAAPPVAVPEAGSRAIQPSEAWIAHPHQKGTSMRKSFSCGRLSMHTSMGCASCSPRGHGSWNKQCQGS